MELKNKHVLVTGAGKRLGRALAEHLLAQGARVTAHSFRTPWDGPAKNVQNLHADLSQIESIAPLVAAARRGFGPVDILINSASDFYPTPAATVTPSDWDKLMDLNLKSPFFLAQACAADLRAQKGCLINLCDIYVSKPLKKFAPYSATKGGLWTLTRVLASEWAPDVRVNSISPGPVLPPDNFTQEQLERSATTTLLGRVGSAQDIVEAADFLLRNEYITGFDLKVDGGASLA
jgi:pteridine reductase